MKNSPLQIRKITPNDNSSVERIIKTVIPEFGACGAGFAINDPEVSAMYEAYQKSGCEFYVLEERGEVVGCGGVAPLKGGDGTTCEIQKMYFLPKIRRKGFGKNLFHLLLERAKALGFTVCYLETFRTMTSAQALYEKNGFKRIPASLGNTGHGGCDIFYAKNL